jgi:HAD superfamily hydrolase (TIGR01490 family)
MDIPSYIAFFDLDRTIISVNSGSLLVRKAFKKDLMSTGDLLNAIFQSYLYKFKLRDTNQIISKMGTWLKGLRIETIDELSEEVVNSYLLKAIRPEIIKEIRFHQEQNGRIVMLSSEISAICGLVGRHLGFEDIICTEMETRDGILTGNPVGNFCFGEEKRVRLTDFCEAGNYNLREAFYYADSVSDLPALEAVGHPVCITPDKKLGRIALEKGWKIHDW